MLEEIGGVSEIEAGENGTTVVRGRSCPFKALVPHHPAVCAMTEAFLAQLSDLPVHQDCNAGGEAPQCRFVFEATDRPSNGAG